MIIIGLGHQKRVGKDTLANHIIAHRGRSDNRLGYNIAKMGFADAVKDEVTEDFLSMFPNARYANDAVLTGLWASWCRAKKINLRSVVTVTWDDTELCPYGKCREALQWWGTEYRRKKDPDYWVTEMKASLMIAYTNEVNIVIITDMRFPNEMEAIKHPSTWTEFDITGETWDIIRLYQKGEEPSYDPHPSEHALDNANFNLRIQASSVDALCAAGLGYFDVLVIGDKISRASGHK